MKQYIVFRAANQYFTVSVLATSRIIALKDVIHVPDTPAYIMGIMESEEEVLPIIDLSKRLFDEPLKDEDAAQVLIVFWKDKEIGLAVNEVLTIKNYDDSLIDYQLDKITSLNQVDKASPIKSFIRTDEGLILELDIENLFEAASLLEINELMDMDNEQAAELVNPAEEENNASL